MNPKLKIVLLLAIAMSLFIIFCDSPNEPDEEEPGEHLFYIAPNVGNMVKIFSVEQEAFIDSLVIDSIASSETMSIHVIGDDSLLAVSTEEKTYIVDLDSKKVISTLQYCRPEFSRDSQYLIHYWNSNCNTLGLYEYPGYSLIHAKYLGSFPTFSNGGEEVIYKRLEGQSPINLYLGVYFIEADTTAEVLLGSALACWFAFASEKYQKIFAGIDAFTGSFLGVIDFTLDTLRPIRNYGLGSAIPVVTPDDEILVYSDIGLTPYGYNPNGNIYFYDISTGKDIDSVEIEGFEMAGMMAISHDSKYMLVGPYNIWHDYTNLLLVELEDFTVISVFDLGSFPGEISAKYCSRNGRSQ